MNSFNVKQSIYAGIIAGLIFMMLEMIMVPLFLGGSPWGPPRMIAAILMGQDVLPPPATFNFGLLMVAMMLHLALSIIYALIIDYISKNVKFILALLIGAIIGYTIYLVNFYVFTGLFPWFADARNWVSGFSHISFGIAAVWAYRGLTHTVKHLNYSHG